MSWLILLERVACISLYENFSSRFSSPKYTLNFPHVIKYALPMKYYQQSNIPARTDPLSNHLFKLFLSSSVNPMKIVLSPLSVKHIFKKQLKTKRACPRYRSNSGFIQHSLVDLVIQTSRLFLARLTRMGATSHQYQ